MTYLDSNILLYFVLARDVQKEHKEKAKSIIYQSLKNDELVISFLTMTETFFVLAKKNQVQLIQETYNFFSRFIKSFEINSVFERAYEFGKSVGFINMNDLLHLALRKN